MTGSTVVIRLRAYRGEQHETTECFNGLRDEAADLIEKLISERDALRVDAERYRWLRDKHEYNAEASRIVQDVSGEGWDDAIDDALGGEKS